MSSLCNHLSTNAFELQPFSGTRRCRFSTVPPGKSSGDVPGDASAGNFIMRNVPAGLLPYAYLARMDKPIGTMLLLYPCWWSTALAAAPTGSAPDFKLMALFGLGAFVMRGAGCTINDMWDRDFDKNVERTQTRPLASGDLNMTQASAFLVAQLSCGLGVLLSLPNTMYCFKLGCLSLPFVALYPTAKRWTKYPQLFLGVTFNWGALMGWAAVHGTLEPYSCIPMYCSGIAWTMLYDTLYAHQDKHDDAKLGLKSTALTFGDGGTKPALYACTPLFFLGLVASGASASMGIPYYAGVTASTAHLLWQVKTAKLDDKENLAYRFRSNQTVGAILAASAIAGSIL